VKANVRIIAATNRDLARCMAQGTFREDLYYRLNVITLILPPLSRRREDIPLLVDHFIHRLNLKKGRKIAGVSREVMDFLMTYPFPGNIRELENIIEHAVVLCRDSLITLRHLPPGLERAAEPSPMPDLKQAEARVIADALARHSGSRALAARELGCHPSTLWRKMKRLGIKP